MNFRNFIKSSTFIALGLLAASCSKNDVDANIGGDDVLKLNVTSSNSESGSYTFENGTKLELGTFVSTDAFGGIADQKAEYTYNDAAWTTTDKLEYASDATSLFLEVYSTEDYAGGQNSYDPSSRVIKVENPSEPCDVLYYEGEATLSDGVVSFQPAFIASQIVVDVAVDGTLTTLADATATFNAFNSSMRTYNVGEAPRWVGNSELIDLPFSCTFLDVDGNVVDATDDTNAPNVQTARLSATVVPQTWGTQLSFSVGDYAYETAEGGSYEIEAGKNYKFKAHKDYSGFIDLINVTSTNITDVTDFVTSEEATMPEVKTLYAGGGSGSADDPYVLIEPNDFATLATEVAANKGYSGKYVKLGADIDMEGIAFTPIGNGKDGFKGIFDGNGKTVSNVAIASDELYVGFFSQMKVNEGTPAQISNLIIDGISIKISNDVKGRVYGGLVGNVVGTLTTPCLVEKCTVKGVNFDFSENEVENAGGLIGNAAYVTVYGCNVDTPVIKTKFNAGGLISQFNSGIVQGCSATDVDITSTAKDKSGSVGGLIATVGAFNRKAENPDAILSASYSTGVLATDNAISKNQPKVGGITGQIYSVVFGCYSTATGTADYFGGVVGYISPTGVANNPSAEKCVYVKIQDCYTNNPLGMFKNITEQHYSTTNQSVDSFTSDDIASKYEVMNTSLEASVDAANVDKYFYSPAINLPYSLKYKFNTDGTIAEIE